MSIGYINDYGEVGLNGFGNPYQFAYSGKRFDLQIEHGRITIESF